MNFFFDSILPIHHKIPSKYMNFYQAEDGHEHTSDCVCKPKRKLFYNKETRKFLVLYIHRKLDIWRNLIESRHIVPIPKSMFNNPFQAIPFSELSIPSDREGRYDTISYFKMDESRKLGNINSRFSCYESELNYNPTLNQAINPWLGDKSEKSHDD